MPLSHVHLGPVTCRSMHPLASHPAQHHARCTHPRPPATHKGGDDGLVRFYDSSLRIVAWFEDLRAGGVCGLSFATGAPLRLPPGGPTPNG